VRDDLRESLEDALRGRTEQCDVSGCESPAITIVLPTNGRTDDVALRCRDCLEFDLDRDWFAEWADHIENRGSTS
jgi:hypothetical protein